MPPAEPRGSPGVHPVMTVGRAAAAAREPVATSNERLLSWREAISANAGSVVALGQGAHMRYRT
jgi:hypothetical protein